VLSEERLDEISDKFEHTPLKSLKYLAQEEFQKNQHELTQKPEII
jgi:hypothetical protein